MARFHRPQGQDRLNARHSRKSADRFAVNAFVVFCVNSDDSQ